MEVSRSQGSAGRGLATALMIIPTLSIYVLETFKFRNEINGKNFIKYLVLNYLLTVKNSKIKGLSVTYGLSQIEIKGGRYVVGLMN